MKIIAHRGWSSQAPENTAVAIEKAIDLNVDMVEIDIRRTRDFELVVFHDAKLSRLTGHKGMVRNRNQEELLNMECGSWFGEGFADQKILSLDEALEICKNRMRLMIEIKIDKRDIFNPAIPNLLKSIERHGMEDQVCIQSFNRDVLKDLNEVHPEIELHKLIVFKVPMSPFYFDEKISTGKLFSESFYKAINISYRYVTIPLVQAIRKRDKEIYCWTADKIRPMNRLSKLDVDGIITNYPSKLKTLLSLK
jgi:glycerophosphoryl diester phosphodiesterase